MVYTPDKPDALTIPRCRSTREEYHSPSELGFFRSERAELIEGDIVRMSSIGPSPDEGVTLIVEKLCFFGRGYSVRVWQALVIADSDPEPDIAAVVGEPSDHRDAHSNTAPLVVEVWRRPLQITTAK